MSDTRGDAKIAKARKNSHSSFLLCVMFLLEKADCIFTTHQSTHMFLKKSVLTCSIIFTVWQSFSQTALPVPRNILAAYDKDTRSANGSPGTRYWQNTADYLLNINFDPVSRQLTGVATIHYVNNSPDTLNAIWFKLYPNLYKKGSPRVQSIDDEDAGDGVMISNMLINDTVKDMEHVSIEGTNMIVNINKLAPGNTIDFRITYTYKLNKGSHIRTGEIEPGADFVAYFFPRIAVYDDIDGWNKFPYNGSQEFYNDFCHFKASITVPKNYVVAATITRLTITRITRLNN